MTNVESMDYTHSHPSTIASLLCRATFAGTIHPRYTFLKKDTIPTYYGISIAIPRYIAMQLSTISSMTRFIIVILLGMII